MPKEGTNSQKYVHLPTQRNARLEGIHGRCPSRAVMHWPPARNKYHQLTTNTSILTTNKFTIPLELCFHYFFTSFLQFFSVRTCSFDQNNHWRSSIVTAHVIIKWHLVNINPAGSWESSRVQNTKWRKKWRSNVLSVKRNSSLWNFAVAAKLMFTGKNKMILS